MGEKNIKERGIIMLKFKIRPFDVLFLGSGRPFNLGDTAISLFPPLPHTLAGAICSKMYHSRKISPSRVLKAIYGPFLFNEKENLIYFPKPTEIYRGRKKEGKVDKIYLLKFFDRDTKVFKAENTNKPEEVDNLAVYCGSEEIEPFKGFISTEGLKCWLEGRKMNKNDIKTTEEIFKEEKRVGIKQDISVHTVVQEDGLYRIDFVRLRENWGLVFWVNFNYGDKNMEKANLKNDEDILEIFNSDIKVLKLGGEMRAVSYEVEVDERSQFFKLFKQPELKKGDTIKILFLTPGVYERFIPQISGVKIISIVSDGYLNVGLHSLYLSKYKLMKKALLPGTVIYGTVENEKEVSNLWLSSSDGLNGFIGSNLIIYGKV